MAEVTPINKFYTRTKTIDGVEYTAQFCGLSAAMKAVDSCYIDGTGNISIEKLSRYVLDNIIVNPRCKVDDFDDMETLNEVVRFGQEVMQGKFRHAVEVTGE